LNHVRRNRETPSHVRRNRETPGHEKQNHARSNCGIPSKEPSTRVMEPAARRRGGSLERKAIAYEASTAPWAERQRSEMSATGRESEASWRARTMDSTAEASLTADWSVLIGGYGPREGC
jgi:hypothetical protein